MTGPRQKGGRPPDGKTDDRRGTCQCSPSSHEERTHPTPRLTGPLTRRADTPDTKAPSTRGTVTGKSGKHLRQPTNPAQHERSGPSESARHARSVDSTKARIVPQGSREGVGATSRESACRVPLGEKAGIQGKPERRKAESCKGITDQREERAREALR